MNRSMSITVITRSSMKRFLVSSGYFGDSKSDIVLLRVKFSSDFAVTTVIARFFFVRILYCLKRLKLSLSCQKALCYLQSELILSLSSFS